MPATILLVSSSRLAWRGLREIVRSLPDLEAVGDVQSWDEALQAAQRVQPHGVILQSRIDGRSTVPLVAEIRAAVPAVKIMVIGDNFTPEELTAFGALGLDAPLLWSHVADTTVGTTIRAVMLDSVFVASKPVAEILLEALRRAPRPPAEPVALIHTEQAVLRLLDQGLNHAQIAARLEVTARTITRTIARLQQKFGVSSEFGIGKEAQRRGLL